MENLSRDLQALHARWAPVESRVQEIRENIERSCADRKPGESHNRANERHAEEFIAWLRENFAGRTYEVERNGGETSARVFAERWHSARRRTDAPVVVIERQRLSAWALRTTRWNFVFTIPGESPDSLLLVAHYDTWRGPGADDNSTGEEILKQYLLADLRAARRPVLTHIYFLAGSEECGLVGLLSQLLLAGGLIAAMQAWQQANWLYAALALALCPLASYRFGVSGSREWVRALSGEELDRLRAVVSVDSVGEGRMFIPRSTLGADFIRALIPYGDYDAFTDVLEEGAHLHHIKYNSYLAGGTTDHLSFLEVNNGLWVRAREMLRRAMSALAGRPYIPPRRIPASALVAMLPGKASPLVFGGKIHTSKDTPDRVYPQPLREALLILDYVFHIVEGGLRPREPRAGDEFHYARLYAVAPANGGRPEYWLALKDALEPNRRNLNAIYRAETDLDMERREARLRGLEPLGWGVDTRLDQEVEELARLAGVEWRRVPLDRLEIEEDGFRYKYARHRDPGRRLLRLALLALAWLERQMGRFNFLLFFATAFVVSEIVTRAMIFAFQWSYPFQEWFFRFAFVTLPATLVFQLAILIRLMTRHIPTWIDNHYRHENRADNLGSLKRI